MNEHSPKKNFWVGNDKCKFGLEPNRSHLISSLLWQICPPHKPFKKIQYEFIANSFSAWAVGFIV